MKRIIIALLIGLIGSCANSVFAAPAFSYFESSGSRSTVKKSVKIGNFNKIEASTAIKVIFIQGKATGVAQITTTESASPYLRVETDDKVLKIYYSKRRPKNHSINGPTIVTIQAPVLNSIDLSNAASFVCKGTLNVKGNLNIDLSSSSKVTIPTVRSTSLNIDLSSSASVDIDRIETSEISIDTSSASSVNIDEVLVPTLKIDSSSSSSVNIRNFSGHVLDVDCSSVSKVQVNNTDASTFDLDCSSLAKINIKGMDAETVNASVYSQGVVSLSGYIRNMNRDLGSQGKIKIDTPDTPKSQKKVSRSSSSSSSYSRSSSTKNKTSKTSRKKNPVPTQAP
ncbi:MAG: DUF2807 domain-containing protein [Muribaculaceae bacterium]|nr:DUF2807 domain-containing protein [Muribaculaceae bacterium]MDE6753481.1 DUF2807 domain-containing protein [Muribaculaceae bacterium]